MPNYPKALSKALSRSRDAAIKVRGDLAERYRAKFGRSPEYPFPDENVELHCEWLRRELSICVVDYEAMYEAALK